MQLPPLEERGRCSYKQTLVWLDLKIGWNRCSGSEDKDFLMSWRPFQLPFLEKGVTLHFSIQVWRKFVQWFCKLNHFVYNCSLFFNNYATKILRGQLLGLRELFTSQRKLHKIIYYLIPNATNQLPTKLRPNEPATFWQSTNIALNE